jgi:hypothetical protein
MRYNLPKALGGGEVEALGPASGAVVVVAPLEAPEIRVTLPWQWLTEVKPLLPEEPAIGTVVLDRYGQAWQNTGGWSCTTSTDDEPWSELHTRYGPLARLVPDPFAEPVELPWEATDDGADATEADAKYRRVDVSLSAANGHKDVIVRVDVGRVNGIALSHGTARAMARALMAAADAAENAQP